MITHCLSRASLIASALAIFAFAACQEGPTQPSPAPIVPVPPPAPPPTPPPAPPPPPSSAPWYGFIGTETGLVEISLPPQALGSYPRAINDASEVVGAVQYAGLQHAFLWSAEAGTKDLGVLPGGSQSVATAINAAGDVVGYSSTPGGTYHAFRWTANIGMVDLGVLPGCVSSSATGINGNGDVVGTSVCNPSAGLVRPFRWSESRGMEELGTLQGEIGGGAAAVNDRGEMTGYGFQESPYDDSQAILWTGVSNAVQLGACKPADCSAEGRAINGNGDIAGVIFGRAAVWMHAANTIDLGGFAGEVYSIALGINDDRQVVGVTYPTAPETAIRAFLWTESGGTRRLSVPGRTEVYASAINNKGEIVGYAR